MKSIELWWSRELGRIASIMRSTAHLLDDAALEEVWQWSRSIQRSVETEYGKRKTQ